MSAPPPPNPKSRKRLFAVIVVISVAVIIFVAGTTLAIRSVLESGITRGPDNLFGEQNLKTAVALIELHKVRFGKYPGSLSDLQFTGEWDQIALQNVRYYPNADRTAYYIEVERGWIGKPDLEMSDAFWHGTGYSKSLKPTIE